MPNPLISMRGDETDRVYLDHCPKPVLGKFGDGSEEVPSGTCKNTHGPPGERTNGWRATAQLPRTANNEVDPPELLNRLCDGVLHLLRVPDIGLHGETLVPSRVGELLCARGEAV